MRILGSIAALVMFAATALPVQAGDCTCDAASGKVCKLVKTTKKVKTTVYKCVTKQVCLPCRSCKGESGCDCSGKAKINWEPTGAVPRTVKKLVKCEVIKEVPVYKWELVDAKEDCSCTRR